MEDIVPLLFLEAGGTYLICVLAMLVKSNFGVFVLIPNLNAIAELIRIGGIPLFCWNQTYKNGLGMWLCW